MHILAQAANDMALLPRIYLNWISILVAIALLKAKEQLSSADT
jgi:hypothetical protein